MIDIFINTREFLDVLSDGKEKIAAPRAALMNAVLALDQDIRKTFRTATDPWGQPWPKLSEATLMNRLRAGGTSLSPLQDEMVMFRSLDRGVDSNLKAFITIGGEGRFPEVHQFGNPSNRAWGGPAAPIPARPMFPIRAGGPDIPPTWAKKMMKPLDDLVKKAFK